MFFIALLILQIPFTVFAEDWPMWRYDEGRSSCSPEELPAELHLLWSWQFSQREPVWDDSLNRDMMPLRSFVTRLCLLAIRKTVE